MTPADPSPSSGHEPDRRPPSGFGRDVAPFLGLGIQLAATVLIMYLAGYWVDGKFGTYPFGQVVGGLVGCVGGLIAFAREASRMGDRQHDASHED